ncbi:caspase family protein [Aphanothece sacrum]|uniref:Peptidase n=1 Tax=Aphanothece sacrum FPU1 TaxID=1920663 RepID=A0A401ILW2_APHSA|nr:caspase family protein [Aphanothece sacrum]GBF82242.1 peptidase [Aphanothece sacrum FPU1]
MENFRAIVIGIDYYLHCPPLKSSETNAQAIYRYFFEDAHIPSHQLQLLTDTSPSPGKNSTYPNQENIRQWINNGSIPVKMGWFFFQGYGINYQGQDYLMPIDGQLQAIAETGIHLRSLLERLQRSIQQLIIVLDLYPIVGDSRLGEQILDFAQKRGIKLILYREPYQNSSQGVKFTTALLEALRYYGHHLTLSALEAYLQERLLGVKSSHKLVVITPTPQTSRQPLIPSPPVPVKQRSRPVVNKPLVTLPTLTLPPLPQPKVAAVSSHHHPITPSSHHPITPSPHHPTPSPHSITPSSPKRKGFFLGGGIVLLMGLFGSFFLLFNNSNFWNGKEESQKNREILNKAKITLSIHQASRFSQSIALARQIYPDTPFYNEAQTSIIRWSEAILEIAQGRAMKGDFEGAIIAAQLVPQEQKTLYLLAQKYLQNWQKLSQQKQYNQVLIDAALGLIRPQQGFFLQSSNYHPSSY